MNEITVRPTMYGGVLFRSRNEARWARFFDLINERWVYEPRRFKVPCGGTMDDESYLPDFLLPDAYAGRGMWIECKPQYPDHFEGFLAAGLGQVTHQRVVVVWGSMLEWALGALNGGEPDEHRAGTRVFTRLGCALGCETCETGWWFACEHGSYDVDSVTYCPTRCGICNTFGWEFEGRSARVCHWAHDGYVDSSGRGPDFTWEFVLAQRYDFERQTPGPFRSIDMRIRKELRRRRDLQKKLER